MNGPDLTFLAQRAAGLDDRTTERLADVHDRIETTRRRRRTAAVLGVAGLVVALVLGLTFLDNGPGRKTPSPAPTPAPDMVGTGPDRGTCWAVPSESVVDETYWFDDSDPVPCTEPHTTETAGYLVLEEATAEDAEGSRDACWQIVHGYLGIGEDSWISWGVAMFLPSHEQVDAGATWVRCDAMIPTEWSFPPYAGAKSLTRSLEFVADAPPPDLWACLDRPPTVDQPFVPCDQPHAYEQTGTLATLQSGETYPSAKARRAAEQAQCPAGVPAGVTGVAVTAAWDDPEYFQPWSEIGGACVFFNTDGSPLPPR